MAAVRDPTDPSVFSGIPHYFLRAAVKGGILDGPVRLPPEGLDVHVRRVVWNSSRLLTGDRPGGYRYVPSRRERQWSGVRPDLPGTCILVAWQVLPPSVVDDDSIEKWFFVDQTLTQLHEEYGEGKVIGRRVARQALIHEQEGYEAARGVILHSQWAAKSVINDYRIDPAKVHVVTQAANVDHEIYATWEQEELARRGRKPAHDLGTRPLRLLFVGLDGRRKGLDRLLRGLAIARREGSQATVRVIGCTAKQMPAELRDLPGVQWCGRIDKRTEGVRFLRLVANCDVGVLLSGIEAGGCGLWEYQAAGLAVLGTNAGGAPEQILPGNGLVVGTAATDDEIAAAVRHLERDPDVVHGMRQAAWNQRRAALWAARIDAIRAFWPHVSAPRDESHKDDRAP